MKKIIILVVLLIAIVAALPIIGNSVVKEKLDTRISELKQYGIKTKTDETHSTYLNTSRHFEFVLEDSQEFIAYLNKYSDQQIPPYVNSMLDGVVIGADIEYANFPLSKAISVELYPLSLSKTASQNLQKSNNKFYKYLDAFLKQKGVLYHINYDLATSSFSGYIKDINESYTLEDNVRLNVKLSKAIFDGKGDLIAPTALTSEVKELHFEIVKDGEEMIFDLNDFSSTSSFESQTTYLTSAELKSFKMIVSASGSDFDVKMDKIRMNASSNTQGEYAELNSKTSLEALTLNSKELSFNMKNFNFDIAANGVNKEAFEELRVLFANKNIASSPALEEKLRESLLKLLSKGFVINIAEYSLENLTLNATQDLKGFDIKSTITIKEDPSLAQKIKMSPLLAIANLNLKTDIKISQEMYTKLTEANPMSSQLSKYAVMEKGNVVFLINFIDGKLSVNGKALR